MLTNVSCQKNHTPDGKTAIIQNTTNSSLHSCSCQSTNKICSRYKSPVLFNQSKASKAYISLWG